MSASVPFAFPPPPPPPPKAAGPSQSQYANNSYGSRPSFPANRGPRGRGRGGRQQHGNNRCATGANSTGQFVGRQPHVPSDGRPPNSHFNQSQKSSYDNQRGSGGRFVAPSRQPHTQDSRQRAFHSTVSRTAVAPAVPSFGTPLGQITAAITNQSLSETKERIPKKRKFNALGLTPKSEEREDSEVEEIDEESQYAAAPGQKLTFEYKGQTSTLTSRRDIDLWIEQRRKNYPTRARIQQKLAEKEKQREAAKAKWQGQKVQSEPAISTDAKSEAEAAQRKRTRLMENLEAQEQKLARLRERVIRSQAAAEKTKATSKPRQEKVVAVDSAAAATSQAARSSQDAASYSRPSIVPTNNAEPSLHTRKQGITQSDSEDSETDTEASSISSLSSLSPPLIADPTENDITSSCGSSSISCSSSYEDEDNDDDEPPEQVSTKAQGHLRVPPPERKAPTGQCHYFLKTGRCGRQGCLFQHDASSLQKHRDKNDKRGGRPDARKRVGLYQRMVDKEIESENLRVLEAIKYLAESGALEEKADSGRFADRDG
ncbi:MAG: hypothetical protein M1825_002355 [Sarcosagium campestre]|nr:MAG: hypothetical protein M1825_002355 [Sarcosagium campestre]